MSEQASSVAIFVSIFFRFVFRLDLRGSGNCFTLTGRVGQINFSILTALRRFTFGKMLDLDLGYTGSVGVTTGTARFTVNKD